MGDGPSFIDAVRGAAHGYDFMRGLLNDEDPKLRQVADNLDEITLEQAIQAAEPGIREPKITMNDAEWGLDVAIDTAKSDVRAESIEAEIQDGGVRLSAPVGWETIITPNGDHEIDEVDVEANHQMAAVSIYLSDATEDSPDADGMTVREYVEDNPLAKKTVKDSLGDGYEDFMDEHGDKPVGETMLDDLL